MSVIRWEDPPPTGRALGHRLAPKQTDRWAETARQLRERPGRWAVVATVDADTPNPTLLLGYGGMIRTGRLAAFRPAGAFEATTRTVEGAVYARFIGDPL